jgi:Fe2+ transport system protein FeoA
VVRETPKQMDVTLDQAEVLSTVVLRMIVLAPADRVWLAAVGIDEGETVKILRRAPFGGPIHIRLATGGEFALGLQMARAITVDVAQ